METGFDIVISTYRFQDLFYRTLQSVLRQQYKNVQIYIADTGEVEHLYRIVEECGSDRIQVVSCEGLTDGAACKKAFLQGSSEYVMFLDSYTVLKNGALTFFHETLMGRPTQVLEYSYHQFGKNGKNNVLYRYEYLQRDCLENFVTTRNMNQRVFNKILKRNLLYEEDFFDVNIGWDRVLVARMMGRCDKHNICTNIFAWRDEAGSGWNVTDEAIREILLCDRKIFETVRFWAGRLMKNQAHQNCIHTIEIYTKALKSGKMGRDNRNCIRKQFHTYYRLLNRHESYMERLEEEEKHRLSAFHKSPEYYLGNILYLQIKKIGLR